MFEAESSIDLGKLFSKGSVIYTKHCGMQEPLLSVVQRVEERDMLLGISESFFKGNVSNDGSVCCQMLEGDYEYIVLGTITKVFAQYPFAIKIHVEKVSKYKNNRVFKRYPVKFEAKVFFAGSNNTKRAVVKNISIIGAGLVSNEHIHENTIITLKILTFISNDEALEFKARVVRSIPKDSYYEYGLEIIDINQKNKDMLDKVIFCLNTNENTFVEDLLK